MKVLIADDDFTTRVLLKAVLTKWGYDVLEAENGQEAMERLNVPDGPAMAVVDWMMPIMTGVELCQKIREQGNRNPCYIILLTSKGSRQDIIVGLNSGADDFVAKPYDNEELKARLNVGKRIIELQQETLHQKRLLESFNQKLEQRVHERTQDVERLLNQSRSMLYSLSHDLKTPLTSRFWPWRRYCWQTRQIPKSAINWRWSSREPNQLKT